MLMCISCHPDQPKWTDTAKKEVRVCRSLIEKFYGRPELDKPTDAYNQCGGWTDPDPVLTPVDVNDRSKGFTADTDDPILVFPSNAFKNAEEFFDGWKQAEIPFMDGYKIILVEDLAEDGTPNVCFKTATRVGLTAAASALSVLALYAF